MDGWLVLDKPQGLTSTRVGSRVKRLLQIRKIGHLGTLDPLATGVLVLALNEATKLIPYVEGSLPEGASKLRTKTYAFDVRFGEATTTLDAEGEVTETSSLLPDQTAVEALLPAFLGTQDQLPPVYSALKIQGRRACDLARAGVEVALKPRRIMISALTLEAYTPPVARFQATVSGGTYIRSLARDLARALGTVGHVTRLRRLADGAFDERQAIALDSLDGFLHNGKLGEVLVPIGAVLGDIPAVPVSAEDHKAMMLGQTFPVVLEGSTSLDLSVARFLREGALVGMGSVQDGRGVLRRLIKV